MSFLSKSLYNPEHKKLASANEKLLTTLPKVLPSRLQPKVKISKFSRTRTLTLSVASSVYAQEIACLKETLIRDFSNHGLQISDIKSKVVGPKEFS